MGNGYSHLYVLLNTCNNDQLRSQGVFPYWRCKEERPWDCEVDWNYNIHM